MWRDGVFLKEEVATEFKGRPVAVLCLAFIVLTHTRVFGLVWF